MTDFIINTPSHKQWMLPDNIHMINSIIYGNDCVMSVMVRETYRTRESFTVKLDNPQWKELCNTFVQLAEKRYPKRLQFKREEARLKSRLYR